MKQEITREKIGDKTKIVFRFDLESEEPIFVKVHAVKRSAPFGLLDFKFTGSHCDELGNAIPLASGWKILPDGMHHEEQVNSDAIEDISARFENGISTIADRVMIAVRNERVAAASL